MLRTMVRLTRRAEMLTAGSAIALGMGTIAYSAAAMSPGSGRTVAVCLAGVVMLAVLLHTVQVAFRRHHQLTIGKCPSPMCSGVVVHSPLAGKGQVVCPTCRRTWPELHGAQYRAPSRAWRGA